MKSSALTATSNNLIHENQRLREQLEEAEATIRAIRGGEVDAVVIEEDDRHSIRHLVAEEILCQSILEQVADAVIICDNNGTVLRSSRAVKELLYDGDPYGKAFDAAFKIYRTDQDTKTPLSFQALVFSENLRGFEVTSRNREGEEFYHLLSAGTLRDHDDSVLGAVVTLTDITDRKRAEASLRLADRRKDEFLATLAHELRNPLAPLHNALNVLQLAQQSPHIHQQAYDVMSRQLKQMVRLVDDLLDVSRITRNNIELRKERILLSDILETALETARPLVEDKKHAITVTLPPEAVYLEADAVRMAQVFSNLLNNAAKYTPANGKIWLEASVTNQLVTVRVRDNGIGMDAKMLPHVFEMFAQADNSLERSYGGLGIGLTLVRSLLDHHGGTVVATSKGLNKGSEFIATLPVSASSEKEDTQKKAGSEASKLKIIVVDDNESSAKTMGWMLELLGHQVQLLTDGSKLIDTAKALRPNAILLDIGMPGMNGYDLCRALRTFSEFKDTNLIAQTGWGQEEDRRMAREAGFDHHLVKPVSLELLQKALEEKR